jgi:hypothetical protein
MRSKVQRLQQVFEIVRVLRQQAGLRQCDAMRAAEAAQVRQDEAMAQAQRRDERQPHRGLHRKAVKQDYRCTAADAEVVKLGAVARRYVWHERIA